MTEYEKMQKHIRLTKIITLAVFILLLCLFGVYKYQHTFTTQKWLSSPGDREKLVDNMLRRYELTGMTRDEVITLLGNDDFGDVPSRSFKMGRVDFYPENTLVYYTGVDFMDDVWLIISLEDGVVTDYTFDVT